MSTDDRFEHDLRQSLDELGSEPAPDRLLARVRSIPSTERRVSAPGGRFGRPFGMLGALAAVFVVVAITASAILLRSSSGPLASGTPAASPSAPAESADVTASPSPATPTPSPAMPTPEPSPVVPSAPPATPTPSPLPPVVGGPVPAGFEPMSITFASPTEGWVLGTAPCGPARCTLVVHTADAGRSWKVRSAPDVATGALAGVHTIRFADPLHGWMYGTGLWATADGGITWTKTTIPAFTGSETIYALEVARGTVHAVGAVPGGFAIATSAVGSSAWHVSPASLPVGGGPVPAIQLVLSGGAGWILQNDRVVIDGARLTGGSWAAWGPPCADSVGPAFIGASTASDVVAVCDVGLWATPQGVHLYVSKDGGSTFTPTGPKLPLEGVSGVATPTPATIVAAGFAPGTSSSLLVGSFDGGKTWSNVLVGAAAAIVDLGFTTKTQGVAISTRSDGTSQLFMTRDGGHTWAAVRF